MRSHRTRAVLIACGLLAGACLGGSDEQVPETVHDPGYRFRHSREADADLFFCQQCHGKDFEGTSLVPSCFVCHPSGPPFVMHPPSLFPFLPWRFPANHGNEAKRDLAACQGCHGELGGPGSNPAFDIPLGDLDKGCESADGCHSNGTFDNGHNPSTAHPSLNLQNPDNQDLYHWYGERIAFADGSGEKREYLISHYDAGNLAGACALCHGARLQGGNGPACTDCHITGPVADPGGCVSCHGAPPVRQPAALIEEEGREDELEGNPVYQRFLEEVAGGFHLEHDAIPCAERESTGDCRTCHGTTANVDGHHELVGATIPENTVAPFGTPGDPYECLTCHEVVFNPVIRDFEFEVVRECAACHIDPFPPLLPCPEQEAGVTQERGRDPRLQGGRTCKKERSTASR